MSSEEDFEPPIIEGEPREEPIEEIQDIPFALDPFLVEINEKFRVEVEVDGKRHTVELRDPLEFEDEFIDSILLTPSSKSRRGANIPIKGPWISGWLEEKGEDYINNIWHNYQFFLKYLEGRTKTINNVSTYKRSPGTYDSMYRYIIILEEAGVLERFKRVKVDPEEYDFHVPEEMRTRTFIRVKEPYNLEESPEEVNRAWENPIESVYEIEGGPITEAVEEIEEEEVEEIPTPEEEGPGGLERFTREEEPEEEVSEEEAKEEIGETQEETLEELGFEEDRVDISQFNKKRALVNFIDAFFDDAISISIENSPLPVEDLEESQFSPGSIAVFGRWAEGTALPGTTELDFVIGVDASQAPRMPGFIPAGVQSNLKRLLDEENTARIVFPEYNPVGVYENSFVQGVEGLLSEGDLYYDLREEEFTEV